MLVSAILLVLAVIAVAAPHQGMIDLPGYHDVGVLFKEGDFKGESKFLIEKKGTSECLPIALGPDQSPMYIPHQLATSYSYEANSLAQRRRDRLLPNLRSDRLHSLHRRQLR